MEVTTSGCVLSSLFFEQINSKGDSEGLLLGETVGRTFNTVSDSQAENIRHERQIVIQGFIPCSSTFSFYDRAGRIHEDAIADLLQGHKQEVVGWYRFRRNTQTLVSLREKAVHHNLLKYFKKSQPQEFVIGVFVSSVTKSRSTHSHDYCFSRYQQSERTFEPVHVNIVNLGSVAQSEYNTGSRTTGSTSDGFEGVLSSFRSQFLDEYGSIQQVSATRLMYQTMVIKLKELANEVRYSENDTASLASEVQSLRKVLDTKKKMLNIQTDKNAVDSEKITDNNNANSTVSYKSPVAMECDASSSSSADNIMDQTETPDNNKENRSLPKQTMDWDQNNDKDDDDDNETQDVELLDDENGMADKFSASPIY